MEGSKDDSCELNKQSYPNFYLANLFYILQLSHISVNERNETLQKLMDEIKKNNMHPYYNYVCEELNINRDQDLYNSLKEKADEELNEIEKKILEATEDFDSIDTKNDVLLKANFFCKIGDKENAYKEYEEIYKKGIGIGAKLDILLTIIRISIFFNDMKNTKKYLEQAKMQMEKGGDWERKNKLKIYEALNYIMIRNFPEASKILIDAASTFTATEIISYDEIIFYVVILGIMTEERTVLNKKILNSSVILQVTSSDEDLHSYISSFYHCDYRMFMEKTIKIALRVKRDRYLGRHYRYFIRNTRVRAYRQFLEPFKSVTLKNMAYAFGVSEEFIEEEVSSFIANEKLNCKIDKVNGSIESNQPNERNTMYLNTIKKGDILLNRIQKLSRVIDM
ncbi:26S proteasome regulatory subunit RPN7, putative [Plasmodium ovale]|uniref:26S proteasome regulatory subunit RPN7, putative n=2 Tax=Plasmodium ovale TaxID=36330 RepID=A0A1A8XDW5_PLAOA|nr:26S proteasome regulatory subunit RPN7, putative [Plasmodium ovale curtisi]SBT02523.1 26S proteasome regulatory subunit RPN7, putative [Plasmodium ovale curtisi]SCP04620.1 26S proteasome regulatory subunit RPN7, putative [Plasmodium ovale]